MAKKKSKKTKQDARGYSTSVATKPVAPVASTKATHENLNQLKSILDNHVNEPTISPNAHLLDTGSKRFFKKIESLHDELVYCGFSGHHIQSVIQALGETSGVFSLESALNWLCLNLDDDLPPLFREQCLVETREVDCSAIVEVVKPSNKNLMEPSEIRFDDSVHQHLLFESTKSEEEGEGARKSWILSQYQYEDATEDENDEGHAQEEKAEKCEEEGEELCAEELRLAILEREIKELRESVNDEASNYLRSKQEVKALKSDLAKLESLAKKRRGEAAKAKAERESLRSPGEIEQEEEEEEMVGFDIFNTYEDNKEGQTQSSQPATAHLSSTQSASEFDKDNLFVLSSTGPSIAKGWTGTTPKHQLEEYCRKQKIPRPTFSQLNYTKNGCKVHVLAKPQMSIEQNGPFYSFADAQQFVATIALYRMNPELPMYRMFPPVFSGLWKSWVDKEKTALSIQRQEDRAEKERKIQKLIDLIPATFRADGSSEKLHGRRVDRETKGYASSEGGASINGAAKERQSTKSQSGSGLQDEFLSRSRTAEYENMQKERSALPMYSFREELLETVSNNSAIVLCAETGAGKTTQGPQFILEDALMRGNGDKISIICTQPRRISAMSVADRVAEEMCVKLGDLVGYQIRGEAVKSSRTKLLFCTTGVILRRLHGDPTLSGVSLVVCDEVHERSWQNDFLLVVLRRLIRTSRPDLKVLLMSATLDAKLFCSFFGGAPLVNVPGRTFPVEHYFLEHLLDATNHVIEEDSPYSLRDYGKHLESKTLWVTSKGGEKKRQVVDFDSQTDILQVSGNFPGYKSTTQRSMDRVDEKILNLDLVEDVLTLLCKEDNDSLLTPSGHNLRDGAVLVFLPGMSEIRSLTNRLFGNRLFGNKDTFDIVPLHSSLSSRDQKRAFAPISPGRRKIILATNIAETSVTIPDVVCVIDSGLVREIRQDKRYSTSKLILDWCSKASAKQRAGRAGRVKEGICCRLFSSRTMDLFMKDQTTPELQRVPLEEVCLSILAGNLSNKCVDFLMLAPQPPPLDAITLALKKLDEVGAIQIVHGYEALTPMGQHMAKLPVHVRLAKMLIFGAIFQCLDPILTIAASLSGKSPFVNTVTDSTRAEAAHRTFRHETSDFMTYVNLWQAFQREFSKDQGRSFCRNNYISLAVMVEIDDLRRQNLELLSQIGFVQGSLSDVSKSWYNVHGSNERVVHAVICAGLYANIAHAIKNGIDDPPTLWHGQERLHFHPSSVNYGKKKLPQDWIVFHEKFAASNKATVSATCLISPLALVLFGGNLVVKHVERKVVVDDWIELNIAAQTGVKLREMRRKLDPLVLRWMERTATDITNDMVDGIVKLLSED